MRQRAVITGGAGFVGSHLAERLLDENIDVLCLDNFVTGSADNVAAPAGPGRLPAAARRRHRPHRRSRARSTTCCTSPRRPRRSTTPSCPIETLKVGSIGTLHSLGLAREKGARFLLASTSETYGDPLVHPQPETYWGNVNPVGPRACYDEAKRFAEAITTSYRTQHGVEHRDHADLQHLRPADAPERRPGDPDLRPPGAGRRADHRGRRRQPDPLGLLRRRPGRGRAPAAVLRPGRPGEHRQPARADHAGAGRAGPRDRRLRLADRVHRPPHRRSRRCAARTSRWPAPSSAGSPTSTCATAWPGPSSGSGSART